MPNNSNAVRRRTVMRRLWIINQKQQKLLKRYDDLEGFRRVLESNAARLGIAAPPTRQVAYLPS